MLQLERLIHEAEFRACRVLNSKEAWGAVCDFLKQTFNMFINYIKKIIKVIVWTTGDLAKNIYMMYIYNVHHIW